MHSKAEAYKWGFVKGLGLDVCAAGGCAGIAEAKPVAEPRRRRLLLLLFKLLVALSCTMAQNLLFPPVVTKQVFWRVQGWLQSLQTTMWASCLILGIVSLKHFPRAKENSLHISDF